VLRAELVGMNSGALRKRATTAGADMARVEQAIDEDDKVTIVELIVEAMATGGLPEPVKRPPEPVKEGTLEKRGGSELRTTSGTTSGKYSGLWASNRWKARYFVLMSFDLGHDRHPLNENGCLSYWEAHADAASEKKAKGQLLLDREAEFARQPPSESSGAWAFTVFGATGSDPDAARREITLRCASEAELLLWLLCLGRFAHERRFPPVRSTTTFHTATFHKQMVCS
jgi:hypothetical protein